MHNLSFRHGRQFTFETVLGGIVDVVQVEPAELAGPQPAIQTVGVGKTRVASYGYGRGMPKPRQIFSTKRSAISV